MPYYGRQLALSKSPTNGPSFIVIVCSYLCPTRLRLVYTWQHVNQQHRPNYYREIQEDYNRKNNLRRLPFIATATATTAAAYKPQVIGITPIYEPPNTDSVHPVLLSNSKLLTCIQWCKDGNNFCFNMAVSSWMTSTPHSQLPLQRSRRTQARINFFDDEFRL